MHNTQKMPQRALLISADTGNFDVESSIAELKELAITAGAEIIGIITQKIATINNATYIGTGKLEEIKDIVKQQEIDLLIFDDELSGAQIKNIESVAGVRIIDRTMLILDIFAMRALSNEGKLQVELAQQKYLLPRLYGLGTQLSRQGGGIGTRGPGETKLESDRRHIKKRITTLENELKQLSLRRERIRCRRAKNDIVTVAIVGYTNVGKSTLLNFLTQANVLVKNQLFATLDPTARELKLNDGQSVVLIDTVGLIQRLPHQLVQAFKSTLEEAASADIILNICDFSDENVAIQQQVTTKLLSELGCGDTPVITVFNKIDKLNEQPRKSDDNKTVFISIKQDQGIDLLLGAISDILKESTRKINVLIPYSKGGLLDTARNNGKVLNVEYENAGISAEIILNIKDLHLFLEYIKAE